MNVYTYDETYKKIKSTKKSRMNIDKSWSGTDETGLVYADQWCILNRNDAKLLLKLKTTEEGKKWMKETRKKICLKDESCYCPDELYPVNWFIHKLGGKTSFSKHFSIKQTTFTLWDGVKRSPLKLTNSIASALKSTICDSGSIFARKFNNKSAKMLAMKCGE